jgi:glycerophosphoryl diester phosphodiesterase
VKPFLAGKRPCLVAHRGGALLAPENTLAAFERAASLGADVLEIDVRLTADGQLVIIHDETLDRVSNGSGSVSALALAALSRLDAGYAFTTDGGATFPFRGRGVSVPTLREALGRFPKMRFNIDTKDEGTAVVAALAALVNELGCSDRVCVGSERDAQGEQLQKLLPDACHFFPTRAALCHIMAAKLGNPGDECPRFDLMDIPMRTEDGDPVVDAALVRFLHGRDIPVFVWTVNEEADMRALLEMGVDGIMTDRPDLLAKVMGR